MGSAITVVLLQRIKKSFAGGIILTENWEMIAQRDTNYPTYVVDWR